MGLADKKEMLIRDLVREGYLKTPGVIAAFREVPRELFIGAADRAAAYADYPLPIGLGQTISAPHMVAIMTELLEPRIEDVVLEVGAGSGYQAAVLSRLVRQVISIELEQGLVNMAKRNLRKAGIRNVRVVRGDGSLGLPERAPFEKIIVTCGSDRIYPAWKSQLREGGMLLVPVDSGPYQDLVLAKKRKGVLEKRSILSCSFVPLRH